MTDRTTHAPASRIRSLWARARRRAHDEGRDACGEPWLPGFGIAGAEPSPADLDRPRDPERAHVLVGRDAEPHGGPSTSSPETALDRDEPLPGPGARSDPGGDRDRALVDALHRVADSFDRVAVSLDADRRDRRASLDDVESLLRALVGELRSPAAVAPVVLAGTIDHTDAARPLPPGGTTIDLASDDGRADRRPFERAPR